MRMDYICSDCETYSDTIILLSDKKTASLGGVKLTCYFGSNSILLWLT